MKVLIENRSIIGADSRLLLVVMLFLFSSMQSEQGPGAAAYDPASATGILFTLRDLSSKKNLVWSLHPTKRHP